MEYQSIIGTRYKAPLLEKIWSQNSKIIKMRQLWLDLAFFQKGLGVKAITNEGLNEMKKNIALIDYTAIQSYESRFKHDIIAHIHAFGDLCPNAKKFIHLGATSNFINDNVDMICIKESFINAIQPLTQKLFTALKEKSLNYCETPTLAYTHLQPAQLTTVGKRFTMWNADLHMDLVAMHQVIEQLPFRGIKGTVGSEDTLLKIFKGDEVLCLTINELLGDKYGFKNKVNICGQTYSRKYDVNVLHTLSALCQTIYKMMNDIRLLASKNEMSELFEKEQVGSSAMPYKMNPIQCEQICSLCRYVIQQESAMNQTYMNQWLERTLDDSAIKRIIYPECFLLVEYILTRSISIIEKIVVNEIEIEQNVREKIHNIISEQIILNGVNQGYDRQDLHERIRKILIDCRQNNNNNNNNNTEEGIRLLFQKDDILCNIIDDESIVFNPKHYIGRCVNQVKDFYLLFGKK